MLECKIDAVFVKVYIDSPWNISSKKPLSQRWYDKGREMEKEINRHCDDVLNTEVDDERHYECSFCGSSVSDKDDYACCDESVAEHDAKKEN